MLSRSRQLPNVSCLTSQEAGCANAAGPIREADLRGIQRGPQRSRSTLGAGPRPSSSGSSAWRRETQRSLSRTWKPGQLPCLPSACCSCSSAWVDACRTGSRSAITKRHGMQSRTSSNVSRTTSHNRLELLDAVNDLAESFRTAAAGVLSALTIKSLLFTWPKMQ